VIKKIATLKKIIKHCVLCPRKCSIDRTAGEKGFCNLSDELIVKSAIAHYGEEPPLSGRHGAGTIFFSSCNLRCIYCQNYQISHSISGEKKDGSGLAGIMLALQKQGCHNIEAVTPTPHLPGIMESLMMARQKGLDLPLVYNCGGYENPDVLKLIEGLVDIYLPDFKYGSEQNAYQFSGIRDYPGFAVESIKEMVRQIGDSLEEDEGIATRGLIIRHLILPGNIANSIDVLQLIKAHISTFVPISIMSQYTPIPAAKDHPSLDRRITRAEYEYVINQALDMGFETIFTQEVDDRTLSPDFDKELPFDWSQA